MTPSLVTFPLVLWFCIVLAVIRLSCYLAKFRSTFLNVVLFALAIVIIGGFTVAKFDPAFLTVPSSNIRVVQPAHVVPTPPVAHHTRAPIAHAPTTQPVPPVFTGTLFPAIAGDTLLGVLISVVIMVCIIALVIASIRAKRNSWRRGQRLFNVFLDQLNKQ